MSPVVDETAGDLPVRDVGLMRSGLMVTMPDTLRDAKSWKRHHHAMRPKADPQRLFRFPRDHLEDLCLRLQEENGVLRQHTRAQEQRLRRMSTRLSRLRQARPGSGGVKDRDMEDTIQELEARVASLESQKGVLQNKLSLAKQHIVDLGSRAPYKFGKGRHVDGDGGVRRAAQTAPPRYGPTLDDTRAEMDRLCSMAEQVRMAELESLRDTLKDKEKEMEGTVREMRKQQADRHRITIRENVDLIRLQKQLSDKSAALRVSQEKFTDLQEVYETQLEESQRSLRESQGALLEKVEELAEQLKQERHKALTLEGRLASNSVSLQDLDKLHERISDLEGERDQIKENFDALLERTLSAKSSRDDLVEKQGEVDRRTENVVESILRMDLQRMEEMLQAEREERVQLEQEKDKLRQEKEILEEQREREGEISVLVRDKEEQLEREVFQYRQQISALQDRLDSVTKEFDMSVEDLSETLIQIKAFRLQQENRQALQFLRADGTRDESAGERVHVHIQASHAETVLELQKARNLLLLEHQITKDLQEELVTIKHKFEREREENKRRMAEKDKLLSKRALQINTLQGHLKELAYSPRSYKRTIPIQYTWPAGDEEMVEPVDDDRSFSQLRAGESLLEIHLKAATFTPAGLRVMGSICPEGDRPENVVTFCTYSLLDFEVHSTPLVSGSQPSFGFTSRYALTARDLGRLGGQGSRVRVEMHQALGGVRFVTHGSGFMSLMGAMERKGERMGGRANITGHDGEIVGVVDFWARLFPPAEPLGGLLESGMERKTATAKSPLQQSLGWQGSSHEELHDYGGGIPNELLVMLEHCVGLGARWPGLLPDAYLTYRFYDLPPHVSPTVQCSADPVFNDATSYPLAVTADVLHYLRSSSLWVYVFDDNDDQVPPAYLSKTPVPLRSLATGKEIRGDYVLRDSAGGPRGMVRVTMKWKYPFQPPVGASMSRQGSKASGIADRRERRREEAEASLRPVAKPRVKQPEARQTITVQKEPRPPPVKQKSSQSLRPEPSTPVKHSSPRKSPDSTRSTKRSAGSYRKTPSLTPEPRLTTPSHLPSARSSERASSRQSYATLSRKSSASIARTQDLRSVDQVSVVENREEEEKSESVAVRDSEGPDSSESSSSQSDLIIIPPKRKIRKGDKLRVEILSLTFEPSSHVALDESVQRVYVEYRLLGVPMETTETPMSLRKPTEGEEIHYNFTRVIYVDGSQAAPLRQYLYTMLEGTDPNQGRLKFTVVSEPMDDEDECVDVGHAFLDLKELLLSGNDVIDEEIDIVSVDEDKEVVGNLKVSLEAAKALTGIYQEFHRREETKEDDQTDEEEEEEEEKEESDEPGKEKKKDQIQVIDYDDDDSDFD
ncbi:unnamed protein product [Ophioblennius macclurei]